ncbi:MAG: T9SS type A sorting domain-containing protein [Flavobacterium sp.]|uniref:zinc-dependent metalloprotease n=1 Tax=Flavobacterium sp. TaxID=239 RepID=UPI00120B99AD|nr:zinc-dependent metalloprotease family protein [Flavobacterium sp.]RZJ68785.1 MAG: T9SS type A sorting domain-containing protein [Flavobacterium sp.]
MKKSLLFLALALSAGTLSAQKGSSWQKVGSDKLTGRQVVREDNVSGSQQLYQLNQTELQQKLAAATDKFSGQAGIEIAIPNAKGQLERFQVWENSNFEPELQAQFPEIRAYVGKGITDPSASLNFSVSPIGVQTMILRADRRSEFIEPYTTDHGVYVAYERATRSVGALPWNCGTEDDHTLNQRLSNEVAMASNQSYKTMRLALSCTGEYTTYFGATQAGALAGMNATMTRVNGINEKDLAIHLNIIAGNLAVIYTNAATDPYSDAAVGSAGTWNTEVQNTLTTVLGNAAYDIGHLFGASGGGGNAGCIGCVCVDDTASTTDKNKGSGFTSPADGIPQGDNFDVDFVVHEMGHQMGANHTFSYAIESAGVNVEPGSGTSIMAYAGVVPTANLNIQPHSDPYFTYRSILQIQSNMASKPCPISTPLANTPPTINAGADYLIPKGTAFILKGTGSDAQGDSITYCWEQNDTGTAATTGANSIAYPTKPAGPNFRSFNPTASPNRYMPAFARVLEGDLTSTWESVSNVARAMNFTLTGRDSNSPTTSQTATDAMVVNTSALAGPFAVTYPNTTNETWTQNTPKTITWDVAGTNANGINTANVNILISIDNGATFSTLVANTANDGNEAITVPNTAAPYCRIMIEAIGNIYYALSKSFSIGYTVTVTNTCNNYTATPNAAVGTGATGFFGYAVAVPDSFTITDANLTVNITHPRVNDLRVGLAIPGSGTVNAIVYDRNCPVLGTPANMITTFDDEGVALSCAGLAGGNSYIPTTSALSILDGMNSAGTWNFALADAVTGQTGTLNSFTLTLCSTTTTVTLATEDFNLQEFSIYPNPNNGNFNVRFNPDGANDVKINIHDIQGRRIFNKVYPATGVFEENLQLQSVQSGVYIVTVENGGKKAVKRIVVE